MEEQSRCVMCEEQVFIACGLCLNYLCYNHVNTTCLQHNQIGINSPVNTTDTNKNKKHKNEEGNNSKKKSCKCGATTHSRISCSKCPLNKKRRAKQDTNNIKYKVSCIKKKLKQFLKSDQLLPIIKSAICRVNDITYEGAKILELLILDHFNNHNLQQLPQIDSQFIRRIFQSTTTTLHSNGTPSNTKCDLINNIRNEYAIQRPVEMQWTLKK